MMLYWRNLLNSPYMDSHSYSISVCYCLKEQASHKQLSQQMPMRILLLFQNHSQGFFGNSLQFLPWRQVDFLLLASYSVTEGAKVSEGYHWAEIEVRSTDPFILFSSMGHTLFVHCKFLVAIHWILIQCPKDFLKNNPKRTEPELPVMSLTFLSLQVESMLIKVKITRPRISIAQNMIFLKITNLSFHINLIIFILCECFNNKLKLTMRLLFSFLVNN